MYNMLDCNNYSNYNTSPTCSRAELVNILKALYSLSAQQQQQQQQQSSRRRGVCFSPYTSSAEPTRLSAEEVKNLWIPQDELKMFKRDVRQLARAGNLTRGLENCTMERQKHRYLTVKTTLSAHQQGLGSDHTASVASQHSEWSKELAFVQACHDYCTIYQPEMVERLPLVDSIPAPSPGGEVTKKRLAMTTNDSSEEEGRRVRRRRTVVA